MAERSAAVQVLLNVMREGARYGAYGHFCYSDPPFSYLTYRRLQRRLEASTYVFCF